MVMLLVYFLHHLLRRLRQIRRHPIRLQSAIHYIQHHRHLLM
jgi:hypothetical protein